MLTNGEYVSEVHNNDYMNDYMIVLKVKETKTSYIFEIKELNSRYGISLIDMMFADDKKCVVKKKKNPHSIKAWSNTDFTIYPYRAGTPFWFNLRKETEDNE